MTILDLGEFKLRFDNKEVRINIDGDLIDIGARRDDDEKLKTSYNGYLDQMGNVHLETDFIKKKVNSQ